ncbi:hypothetical protein AVEN_35344-1 [Araneus ventricosus]|nr:hypothetical protein AVEN_35344-1 [Araneus ventricosus]
MFKEHQRKLREALRNQTLERSSSTLTPSIEESSNSSKQADEDSSEESSSSSAKIPRLDTEATIEAGAKYPEMELQSTSEAGAKFPEMELQSTSEAGAKAPEMELESISEFDTEVPTFKVCSVGVPVESLEFPQSIFLRKLKEFGGVLKTAYQELRAKMGNALDRISPDHTAHDLKGFTLQKMEKFAKWKYAVKTLSKYIRSPQYLTLHQAHVSCEYLYCAKI